MRPPRHSLRDCARALKRIRSKLQPHQYAERKIALETAARLRRECKRKAS